MNQTKNVLYDIKELGWGKDRETTFIGALEAVLQFLGETTNYNELMGMGATAFRISIHKDWCPSSPDVFPRKHIARHLGYSLHEMGYDEQQLSKEENKQFKKEIKQIIKAEIDAGRPVLAINLISVPDWGVITGYGKDSLFCRTYYDDQAEKDQTSGYSIADNFPWMIYTLERIANKSEVPTKTEAIKDAINMATDQFELEKFELYYNGKAAFDKWISDLQNEGFFQDLPSKKGSTAGSGTIEGYWHANGWFYDSLIDARHAAYQFLENIAAKCEGEQKNKLLQASKIFKEIKDILWNNWIYFHMPFFVQNEENRIWIPGDRFVEGTEWTEEHRKKGAQALKEVRNKEIEAHQLLADIF